MGKIDIENRTLVIQSEHCKCSHCSKPIDQITAIDINRVIDALVKHEYLDEEVDS